MERFRVQNFRFRIGEDKEFTLVYGMVNIFEQERNHGNLTYSLL